MLKRIIYNFWNVNYCLLLLCLGTRSLKLPKLCEDPSQTTKCEIKQRNRVNCLHDFNVHQRENWKSRRIKTLTICHWQESNLDPYDISAHFPYLEKLVMSHGSVTDIISTFPPNNIEELHLVDLGISHVSVELLKSLELSTLDLRRNQLSNFSEDVLGELRRLDKIHLSGNPWNCSLDLFWVLDPSYKIVDIENMTCSHDLYSGKPVHSIMYLKQSMQQECPTSICSCAISYITWDTNRHYLVPFITVNCSNRNLSQFPQQLPKNTTTLDLSRNSISDVLSLAEDSSVYTNIIDVYLDDNYITSVDALEGVQWLKTFRVLSLRGNHLSEIPTYAFDNAFERNGNIGKVYLGGNPWRCDCLFTPAFQHLLFKFQALVQDIEEIQCADREGDPNSLQQIFKLPRHEICDSAEEYINPLDIVSIVLAFLIVLVLGKLVYDYWTFKRTGQLPWLVTKIP